MLSVQSCVCLLGMYVYDYWLNNCDSLAGCRGVLYTYDGCIPLGLIEYIYDVESNTRTEYTDHILKRMALQDQTML